MMDRSLNREPDTKDVDMRSILQRIATGPELSKSISLAEARGAMRLVLDGKVDPVQAGVFLIALRMKRETDDENKGLLEAVRDVTQRATAAVDDLVDIADPYNGCNRTLPAAPFLPVVLAACGVPVVSHGVASVGPKFGVTHHQVLKAAGVAVCLSSDQAAVQIADPSIGWSYVDQSRFCPKLHALNELRTLIVKRPAITTVEVLAGPVQGRRTHLMTGYVHKPYPRVYASLARHAGFSSALLVRGIEGGVIPSLRQSGRIWYYHDGGEEQTTEMKPAELGIDQEVRAPPLPENLPGYRKKTSGSGVTFDPAAVAQAAAAAGLEALEGASSPVTDAVVYGASLVLRHLGRADSLAAGAEQARNALDSGAALARFQAASRAQ